MNAYALDSDRMQFLLKDEAAARKLVPECVNRATSPFASKIFAIGSETFISHSLLGLLTYCYSVDLYSSPQIEDRLQSDSGLKALAGNLPPDRYVLRRFRFLHQSLLQRCIRDFLGAAWAAKFIVALPRATVSEPWLRRAPDFSEEARVRLYRAFRMDRDPGEEVHQR